MGSQVQQAAAMASLSHTMRALQKGGEDPTLRAIECAQPQAMCLWLGIWSELLSSMWQRSICTTSGTVSASLLPLQGWWKHPWMDPCQPRNGGRTKFWRDPATASREFFRGRVTSLRKQNTVPALALPFYQLFCVYISAHNTLSCFVSKYKANGRWENWKIYLRE